MNRNLRHITLLAIVAISLFISLLSAVQYVSAAKEPSNNLSSIESQSDGYLLKDCNGFVGVYYSGEDYPAVITEISLDSLRQYDRELVISGFRVESREQLMSVLEDLGS